MELSKENNQLVYPTDTELAKALAENEKYIAEQVLAVKVISDCSANATSGEIEGANVLFDAKVA